MRDLAKIFIAVLSVALTSCRDFTNPMFGGDIIAKANGKTLYVQDLKSIFPENITSEDSIRLLESFVDQWVKKQLKIQAAEEMFADNQDDIEQMVDDYRNSLLTYKVDQAQIDKTLDTVCSPEEISKYYKDNINDFVLDRSLFKGRMVKLPTSFRLKQKLKGLITAPGGDRYQDFTDICIKNNLELKEFNSWTEVHELAALLPKNNGRDRQDISVAGKLIELEDRNDTYYYVYLTSVLKAGDHTPEERVSDIIRRVLVNKRKENIIRNLEDSLLLQAKQNKDIVINIHKK